MGQKDFGRWKAMSGANEDRHIVSAAELSL
jgi:hypothetical protein